MTRRRYVVTGCQGQVVTSLKERVADRPDIELVALGRPELDLSDPLTIDVAIASARPDLLISAAAYTAVDQAEDDQAGAMAVNGVAPGKIGEVAARLGVPVIHLSTDYVFDGSKARSYIEDDIAEPVSVYGTSKLFGERALAAATSDHVILRTAWVFSPFGRNFVRTMLRLATTRSCLSVVDDQIGNPTSALDLADGILAVADNLLTSRRPECRGLFHMVAAGEATWADVAVEIFRLSAERGGPSPQVERIPTSAFPTAARRPANSRLDCSKLAACHDVQLPDWRTGLASVVARLLETKKLGAKSC
ncbi:dTDP-4-dehydrorhamnose reductase [Oryzibacter oryziterrae]|uniref:dTDP-4-dehydrorhamnose reductase n=1 Tax=Oryzibacter oryziterrae TaxID=2766474 RepID=UPI001F004373|nr:dTDP-4-dehydrorhamnose reductase [Oryzibacter oryziterrae]